MKTENEETLRIEAYNRLVETVVKTKTSPDFVVEFMKRELGLDCDKESCQDILRRHASLHDMNKITEEINLISGRNIKILFSFSRRSTRSEYFKIIFASGILMMTLGSGCLRLMSENYFMGGMALVAILTGGIWLKLAATVRRLHDIGGSGYLSIISLLPLVDVLLFIILLLLDSQPGINRYGLSKKYPVGK